MSKQMRVTISAVMARKPCWSLLRVERYFKGRKWISLNTIMADNTLSTADRIWLADSYLFATQKDQLCAWFDEQLAGRVLSPAYLEGRQRQCLFDMMAFSPWVGEDYFDKKDDLVALILKQGKEK